MSRSLFRLWSTTLLCVLPLWIDASHAATPQALNLTGLPVYPYLSSATMDGVERTDALGRWCRHFSAQTTYPLDMVEEWYRGILRGASETDLTHDISYRRFAELSGIKLGIGVDYVAVYKLATRSVTSIELFRCSPTR